MLIARRSWLFLVLGILLPAATASAAPVALGQIEPDQLFFLPEAEGVVDLIDQASPTFLSQSHVGFTQGGAHGPVTRLNDGLHFGTTVATVYDSDGTWTSTFNLDTSTNTFGYDITTINSYTAWTTDDLGQRWDLFVSTVGSPGFTQIGSTFEYTPPLPSNSNGARLQLTDTTGILASGVDAIQFSFMDPQGPNPNAPSVFREINVLGSATIPPLAPEPATIVLFSAAVLLMIIVTLWRKRRLALAAAAVTA